MIDLEPTPQVWGITGNLGGGKTLTSVCIGVTAISRGYFVISNVTFNMDAVVRSLGEWSRQLYQHISLDDPDFDPFKLPCGSPRGSGGGKRVVIILDECAEWFDQYSSIKDDRVARINSWMRHTSKRSQDVILVVQRKDYLNKSIRQLISKWVIVDDLAYWRMPVLRIRVPFCSGFVMQRHFDRLNRLLRRPQMISKRKWGIYYNTAECLNADGAQYNIEYTLPERHQSFGRPLFFIYAITIILLLL